MLSLKYCIYHIYFSVLECNQSCYLHYIISVILKPATGYLKTKDFNTHYCFIWKCSWCQWCFCWWFGNFMLRSKAGAKQDKKWQQLFGGDREEKCRKRGTSSIDKGKGWQETAKWRNNMRYSPQWREEETKLKLSSSIFHAKNINCYLHFANIFAKWNTLTCSKF